MTQVHFRTSSGDYLCAEGGGGGEVNATRTQAAEWETFDLDINQGASATIRTFDGHYVCAEGGGGGEVNATRTAAGGWETFTLEGIASGAVHGGEAVHLRTDDGHYVCAEGGGGGEVNATRTAAGGWETFTLEVAAQRNPRLQLTVPAKANLGMGHYMQSTLTTSQDGAVRVHTELTCTHKLVGFTGGAKLIFADAHGNTIGKSESHDWGVNQAPIIGAEHRHEDWFASAPAGTDDIALLMFWAPRNRLGPVITAVEEVLAQIAIVVEFILTFCDKYPDLCETISEFFTSSDGGKEPAQ